MNAQSSRASETENGVQFLFMDIDCVAVKERYRNSKATALRIIAADTENNRSMGIIAGEPVSTASINMEYHTFAEDEVAVKTYSENQGLLPILIQAKIVTLTDRRINSSYGLLPVVSINCNKLAEL